MFIAKGNTNAFLNCRFAINKRTAIMEKPFIFWILTNFNYKMCSSFEIKFINQTIYKL